MHTDKLIAIAIMIAGSLIWGGLRYLVTWLYKRIDDRLDNMRSTVRRELELLETERTRIANDLHDDLGALLSAVSIRINCLGVYSDGDRQNVLMIRQYLQELTRRIGIISHNLTPQTLIHQGLNPALEEFFNRYKGAANTDFDYVYTVKSNIPQHKCLQLYRIVQELVHNGLKHSEAARIQLCLYEKQRKLVLLYSDDGIGFNPDKTSGSNGMGWNSLKNRTEILAGKMKLQAIPGKGVEYYFEFPL